MTSPEQLLQVASEAASKAAEFISTESAVTSKVDFKGAKDLVTQADRGSEKIILDTINHHFPTHNILTEESSGKLGDSPYTWIIDPLDGTTNFVHGYPVYSVSIAVHFEDNPLAGIIVDVYNKHTYSALAGGGAFRNNHPLSVTETTNLGQALLATGFPYVHDEIWAKNFHYFKVFTDITQGVRRGGSAAIDLAHVACGWLDGFWEYELHPWDTAAGMLILQEAGGKVTRTDGQRFTIFDKGLLASNGYLHEEMLSYFEGGNVR